MFLICIGGLFGFTVAGVKLAIAGSSPPVSLVIDVVAACCAAASFGTFFSMPGRLLPFPIAVGMLAHAARWAVISAGGGAPAGTLVACTLTSILTAPIVDRLLCGCRILGRGLVDAGFLPVQHGGGPCRIGLNWPGRTGSSADQYRRKRFHSTF
ncbi:hypothetical protein B5V03_31865 [Bradyrhizobium betae]|uniref:Uncharacterized protein n=1 Tax=Bradyrhizobium betae TaxID=244734 RepID=A0A4Q1UR35_9BRAD|nr:hypothetical protein B5V03_31865 [Bradyrhizobium betae]